MVPRENLIIHRQYAPVKRNKGTCKNICINYKIKLKYKLGLLERENILLIIPIAVKPINKNGQLPKLADSDSELFGVSLFQVLPTLNFQKKNVKEFPGASVEQIVLSLGTQKFWLAQNQGRISLKWMSRRDFYLV